MPFGVDLQRIEPAEWCTNTLQASLSERLMCAAQNVDGDLWSTQFSKEMGKWMEDDGRCFHLGGEFRNLYTGPLGDEVGIAFIASFNTGEDDEGLFNAGDRIIIFFIDF